MASIATLNVEQLRIHIENSGLLGSFTDIFGNPQPAPITQTNELSLNPKIVPSNQRIVMIRNLGGVTNAANSYQYDDQTMLIVVVGQKSESDSIITQGLAIDIEKYLSQNFCNDLIFNIVSSGVTGPMITEDSRRAYEINLQVSFVDEFS